MFFNDWLARRQLYTPNRVAIVDDAAGCHYTYKELNARYTNIVRSIR